MTFYRKKVKYQIIYEINISFSFFINYRNRYYQCALNDQHTMCNKKRSVCVVTHSSYPSLWLLKILISFLDVIISDVISF